MTPITRCRNCLETYRSGPEPEGMFDRNCDTFCMATLGGGTGAVLPFVCEAAAKATILPLSVIDSSATGCVVCLFFRCMRLTYFYCTERPAEEAPLIRMGRPTPNLMEN